MAARPSGNTTESPTPAARLPLVRTAAEGEAGSGRPPVWDGCDEYRAYLDRFGSVVGVSGGLDEDNREHRAAVFALRSARAEYRRGLVERVGEAEVLQVVGERDRFFEARAVGRARSGRQSRDSKRRALRFGMVHSPTWDLGPHRWNSYTVLTVGDLPGSDPDVWGGWVTDFCRQALKLCAARHSPGHRCAAYWALLAFQARGAPHWDLLLTACKSCGAMLEEWMPQAWVRISGLHGSTLRHRLEHGVRSQDLLDVGGVMGYMLRELQGGKFSELVDDSERRQWHDYQKVAPVGVSPKRWYGYGGELSSLGCEHKRCSLVDGASDRVIDVDPVLYWQRWDRILCEFLPHWQPVLRPGADIEKAFGMPMEDISVLAGMAWIDDNQVSVVPGVVSGAWAEWLVMGNWDRCEAILMARRESSMSAAIQKGARS